MLMRLEELVPLLRSPHCLAALSFTFADGVPTQCAARGAEGGAVEFPVVDGRPILVDFSRSVLDRERTLASSAASHIKRRTSRPWKAVRWVVQGDPRIAETQARELVSLLLRDGRPGGDGRPVVVVIGGGTIGAGAESLYADPRIAVAGLDIYASPNVQAVADAHDLPLADASVDAVWIQNVLEHVLDPARVAAEISRTLRPGGYVYAETPFMQQVHEGRYDFMRFTQSGHRWLFNRFEPIGEGVVEGPGVALRWAFRYFVAGLTRSRTLGALAGASLFWLRWFDRLIDARHASDGACSLYFLGRKTDAAMVPCDVADIYAGAQR